ncbi:MAG: methyltransferase [Candidatus Aenigmarchaeota archaeon]|nr:methyltransferase [Candidatus Aenigmarchaeota archaeon]
MGGGQEPFFSQDVGIDQVFMRDEKTLRSIVEFSGIRKSDTILEIGTGTGNLTGMIAKKAGRVITIEIDERLKPVLKKQLRGFRNVRIIWGNALEVIEKGGLHFDKIVSNPPYSISEPLIKALFGLRFDYAVMTLPWRFVERLTANPEESRYSKLSMFVQAFFRVETMMRVPEDAWHPKPDTSSVVMKLIRKEKPSVGDMIVQELAKQSDKKLKNAMREAFVRHSHGNGTKRNARMAMEGIGLTDKLMDKKISEMGLDEIRNIVHRAEDALKG